MQPAQVPAPTLNKHKHKTNKTTQTQTKVYGHCEKGDLAALLARRGGAAGAPLPEADLRRWLCQMLLALDYLQSNSVLHRDVKPANIFLTAAGDAQVWLCASCVFVWREDGRGQGRQRHNISSSANKNPTATPMPTPSLFLKTAWRLWPRDVPRRRRPRARGQQPRRHAAQHVRFSESTPRARIRLGLRVDRGCLPVTPFLPCSFVRVSLTRRTQNHHTTRRRVQVPRAARPARLLVQIRRVVARRDLLRADRAPPRFRRL